MQKPSRNEFTVIALTAAAGMCNLAAIAGDMDCDAFGWLAGAWALLAILLVAARPLFFRLHLVVLVAAVTGALGTACVDVYYSFAVGMARQIGWSLLEP